MSARDRILALVKEFHDESSASKKSFSPGDRVNYAGRVYDERELLALVDSSLDFWLTSGRYAKEFEGKLASFLSTGRSSFVNSGSSANLLAFMTLTSPKLGARRIMPGDEIISVAACFPTTVSPIVQYGAVPVFLDIDIPSYNIKVEDIEAAITIKTKAVFLAHTLGNPFNLEKVSSLCRKHKLWLIEDNCDALGSKYLLDGKWHYTGTIGDIGTSSFYPAHHITTGEGGAVYSSNPLLNRIAISLRDWGRDCHCDSGQDNACGNRFSKQFGSLPLGYDHKYVYSHLGYNLKATEMQAAIGCVQLDKLPSFIESRKRNWKFLRDALSSFEDVLILPSHAQEADPSWFGFMLTVREGAPFTRNQIVRFLEDANIQTRNLFAGNIIRHPCFESLVCGKDYRVQGELKNTDCVMANSFWLGVYPGLTEAMLEYIVGSFKKFLAANK